MPDKKVTCFLKLNGNIFDTDILVIALSNDFLPNIPEFEGFNGFKELAYFFFFINKHKKLLFSNIYKLIHSKYWTT